MHRKHIAQLLLHLIHNIYLFGACACAVAHTSACVGCVFGRVGMCDVRPCTCACAYTRALLCNRVCYTVLLLLHHVTTVHHFNYSFMFVYITVVNPEQGFIAYLVIHGLEGQSLRITLDKSSPGVLLSYVTLQVIFE